MAVPNKINRTFLEGSLKARSKSAKSRAPRNRNVRRKLMNTAVLPVAVNASPDAGKAVIPIAVADGPNGDKLVPVAVRRASGEVVIPAEVNRRGGRKRAVAISVAVNRPAKRGRGDVARWKQRLKPVPRYALPQRDPITNLLMTATRIEENAVTLAAQLGITALDLLEHWSRFLLNRGLRVAKATERGMVGRAVRALDVPFPSRPLLEAEVRFPTMRRPNEFRTAA
jgi:hypothetical protein